MVITRSPLGPGRIEDVPQKPSSKTSKLIFDSCDSDSDSVVQVS